MKIFAIILVLSSMLVACTKTDTASDTISVFQNQKTILALGDSLTAGYGLSEADSYPSQLQKRLKEKGYEYQIQNAGISGDTSAGLLSRMDWILDSTNTSPASTSEYVLVILCIGGNDAFQGKSPEDIEKNIRAIIEKLQTKKIPILFAGMKAPLNLGWEYGKQYEAIFSRLAKEYNLIFMDFFLEGVALKANLNQDDRIHPTREGYAIVVENLLEILEEEELITK